MTSSCNLKKDETMVLQFKMSLKPDLILVVTLTFV